MKKPRCFESQKQYDEWLRWARLSRLVMVENAHCGDCTRQFQYEMIRARRCDNPGHIIEEQETDHESAL